MGGKTVMEDCQKDPILYGSLVFCSLEFIWDLACLREAASAKAGARYLVLI